MSLVATRGNRVEGGSRGKGVITMAAQAKQPNGRSAKPIVTRKDKARITKLIKAMNWPWQWDGTNRVWRLGSQVVEE